MAPDREKWIRRFIIPETTRHKNGFTIYKVTSMIFLSSSHKELSKVSVWKRYNDFKHLHLELSNLHKRSGVGESFPTLPKSKYFGRFEAEVIEKRRQYALKFLEFVGRYSYLYSSDTFITFFETSHVDSINDCAHSLSSDTSEDDRTIDSNNVHNDAAQNTFQVPYLSKAPCSISTNLCAITLASNVNRKENECMSPRKGESQSTDTTRTINLANASITNDQHGRKVVTKQYMQDIAKDYRTKSKNPDRNNVTSYNRFRLDSLNNNSSLSHSDATRSMYSVMLYEKQTLSQTQLNSKYILIAAGHISSAFKHESIAEYEEAFAQYKLGISCLITGVQCDPDSARATSIKDKISKYLARAEQLYSRHFNCNVSLRKPISELQYYKILKIMKSVMLVTDIRINCKRVIKTIEKSSIYEDNINNLVSRGQIPYMIRLYAYVETETTIFLILQYSSYGKLWDFIKLHYKLSERLHINKMLNQTYLNHRVNKELEGNENIDASNETDGPRKTCNETCERSHPNSASSRNEIYDTEMPTTQLLEKSQKLLQSVNATLRRSNFIASRLNKSKELNHPERTSSSNAKIVTRISKDSELIPSDNRCNASNHGNANVNDIITSENILIKDVAENQDLRNSNCLTTNSLQTVTENTCTSVLKEIRTISYLYENKTNDPIVDITSTWNVSANIVTSISKSCDGEADTISNETSTSSINCNIDVANSSRAPGNLYNDHEIQHYKQSNTAEERELWRIPETVVRSWGAEILSALEALHQQNVLLNLNPEDILLDDTGHIRLTYAVPRRDIKLSKLTYPYSSPESTLFSPTIFVTSATDIWSLGVILYELLTGIAFVAKHPRSIHSHSIINVPSKLSKNAKSLLHDMLKYYPDERLTVDEIKRHPFFAGVDWTGVVNFQT